MSSCRAPARPPWRSLPVPCSSRFPRVFSIPFKPFVFKPIVFPQLSEKKMSRKSSGRSHLRESGFDSFPPAGHSRKDLQLCRQVADTLSLALGDCGDDCLRDLHVVRVVPAPDASQLLVIVGSALGEVPPAPTEVLAHLQARTPWLRGEVAQAITRKRAPSLLFEYLATAPEEGKEAPR